MQAGEEEGEGERVVVRDWERVWEGVGVLEKVKLNVVEREGVFVLEGETVREGVRVREGVWVGEVVGEVEAVGEGERVPLGVGEALALPHVPLGVRVRVGEREGVRVPLPLPLLPRRASSRSSGV